jgi:hypothetical protein
LVSWRRRIKRLEEQTPRTPDDAQLERERQAHREALDKLYERCLEDDDPTPRRAAVRDFEEWLQEMGRL